MSPLQRHHSAALPLATSKDFSPREFQFASQTTLVDVCPKVIMFLALAKWRRSSFPFFSYTKRHCSRHLSEVQLPQNGSSLRRYFTKLAYFKRLVRKKCVFSDGGYAGPYEAQNKNPRRSTNHKPEKIVLQSVLRTTVNLMLCRPDSNLHLG